MFQHSMQASRFELKYIIDEEQASKIRTYLRNSLVPDPNAKPEEGNAYWVYSLYCDSTNMTLYRASTEGLKNRFKLRIRFYDDDPNHPVFFEIKRRLGDVIKKERAGVQREAAKKMLHGICPNLNELAPRQDPKKAHRALCNFATLYKQIGAHGCVYVYYHREAYVEPDNDDVRVTFDRKIQAGRYYHHSSLMPPKDGILVDVPGIVLELKFTDRYPLWMQELVEILNLWRVPMAKYVACVDKLNTPWVSLPPRTGVAS